MKDLRFRLGGLQFGAGRRRFFPTTGLGLRNEIGLGRHLPLHCVLRRQIVLVVVVGLEVVQVIVPGPRVDARLGAQVSDYGVMSGIRVR